MEQDNNDDLSTTIIHLLVDHLQEDMIIHKDHIVSMTQTMWENLSKQDELPLAVIIGTMLQMIMNMCHFYAEECCKEMNTTSDKDQHKLMELAAAAVGTVLCNMAVYNKKEKPELKQ